MVGAQSFSSYPSSYFRFEGTDIHFIDTAGGESSPSRPAVLLLHGNPTWCYLYRNLLNELGETFRLIAVDYRGCGLSGRDHKRPLRFRDRVDEVVALIEHLHLDLFSLVMHDWGGPIGTGVAERLIDKVVSLTYLNTTLTEVSELPWFIRASRQMLLGSVLTSTTNSFVSLTTTWGVGHKLPKRIRDGYHLPYKTRASRAAIEDFVADIPFDPSHPTYSELARLRSEIGKLAEKPVQIIWGLKDPCFHSSMLRSVRGLFPSAEVLEIPEASHLVIEDAPDIVIPTIEGFLGKVHHRKVSSPKRLPTVKEGDGTLVHLVRSYAAEHPAQQLFVQASATKEEFQFESISYSDLIAKVNRYRRGLSQLGLKHGQRVLFLLPVGPEFLAFAFAVIESGATPVFVDPGVGLANLKKCFRDAECSALIAAPKALVLKTLFPQFFHNLAFEVVVPEVSQSNSTSLHFLQRQLPEPIAPGKSCSTAMIAFTSGATGYPKGVVFTHEMLSEQVRLYQEELGVRSGERNMPLLPIFCLYNAAAGVTSVLPDFNASKPLSLDPEHVVQTVCRLGVTSATGSPTLWSKTAKFCSTHSYSLTGLERLYLIGAPVPEQTIDLVNSVLPVGECFTPYGATEALPLTVPRGNDRLKNRGRNALTGEEGVYVGKPVTGSQIRVIRSRGQESLSEEDVEDLPPFAIGEIIAAGKQVSPLYFNRKEATETAKIQTEEGFWHRMGDVGYLDESGGLFFCGRAVHRVVTPAKTYYSVPTEIVFNRHPQVYRSSLVSLTRPDEVGVVIEPYPQFFPHREEERAAFAAEMRELAKGHPATKGIVQFFFHPSFPVDGRHNAKIFRCRLGRWASRQKKQRISHHPISSRSSVISRESHSEREAVSQERTP